MKTTLRILLISLLASFALYSCSDYSPSDPTGIPSDKKAGVAPVVTTDETNTRIPNPNFSEEGQRNVININFTGIQNPANDGWLQLYGTGSPNQNVWVEVDGVQKGILVGNVSTRAEDRYLADVIFLIDNSASMTEESDLVANEVAAWAARLEASGLDIQFGCVGYDAYGVNGGMEMGDLEDIDAFLNRPGTSGRTRTQGFSTNLQDDAEAMESVEFVFSNTENAECSMKALYFASWHLSWGYRYGANRIYINFTDEPNQPLENESFSVEVLKDQNEWNTNDGTIHTVFSAAENSFTEAVLKREKPWLMSDYTGGTNLFAPSNFVGVSLDTLPVTGALVNSYRIQFKNTSDLTDGTHTVKITIATNDGSVKAVKEYTDIKFGK